jgi:hypothetical protein
MLKLKIVDFQKGMVFDPLRENILSVAMDVAKHGIMSCGGFVKGFAMSWLKAFFACNPLPPPTGQWMPHFIAEIARRLAILAS